MATKKTQAEKNAAANAARKARKVAAKAQAAAPVQTPESLLAETLREFVAETPAVPAPPPLPGPTAGYNGDRVGSGCRSVVRPEFWPNYRTHLNVKTASGRPAVDNCDFVAALLRGMPLEELIPLSAWLLQTSETAINEQYAGKNPGMVRMNLGNRIRKLERLAKKAA